jgi:hypothetical protein
VTWIVDDHDDRLDPLGGTPGGSATTTRQLGQFGTQIRVHPIEEPCGDVATFAWREAKAIVTPECDVHPCADERPVSIRPTPCMALLEHAAQLATQLSYLQVQTTSNDVYFSIVRASTKS